MDQVARDSNRTDGSADAAPELEAWRQASRYEVPTAEKKAFGARLRHAREVAGLTLTDAAVAMGYSQPVQLSNMENGNRPMTLRIMLQAAALYGTTADFLCGLSPDPDPDPAVGVQALVAARVTAEVRNLLQLMSVASVGVVRELRPDAARQMRLASLVLETATALSKLRAAHGEFDDMRGSATLASKLQVAAELAREHVNSIERARRRMGGCALMGLAIDPASHDTTAERPQGFDLHRLRPLPADALAEDASEPAAARLDHAPQRTPTWAARAV